MSPQNGIYTSPIHFDPSTIENCLVSDFIFKIIRKNRDQLKDKEWMIDANTGAKVLFKDVEVDSKRIASGLARLGFKKQDVLFYVTYETAVLYLVHVGVWSLNGAVRGCYQKESIEEYARQIIETKANFVLVDEKTADILAQAIKLVDWPIKVITFGDVDLPGSSSVKTLLEDDGSAYPAKVEFDWKEDVACIPNSSGSTGLPKGALHTHFNLILTTSLFPGIKEFSLTFMTPMSNHAVGCHIFAVHSVVHGCTLIHLGTFEKEKYFDYIEKFKPENVLMYPFVATWFARSDKLNSSDLSCIKVISVAGSVLDPTTAELLAAKLPQIKFNQVYGMTELLNITCTLIGEETDEENKCRKIVCIENGDELCVSSGKIAPTVQVKIVDVSSGECLGPCKRGQILVKSLTTMKGYLTNNSDSPSQSAIDADGWLHTGDIGFFDDKGNLYIKERVSILFKYFMFIVSPTEIEVVLQKHPDVMQVGVVGVPHPESTSLATAFVVRKPGGKCTEQELCQYVAEKLPSYKHLHGGVKFIDKLPESRGNKLDRAALKNYAIEEYKYNGN
ncbi:uncharacterized protein LOC132198053 [Neocloeon triangulifer]|uniref:uncharacterized protein LOC132198053 n=1 Tax=Neocloeon triangulifer TaxID=2078957 RepID=UPI00286FA90D|nr:uncharacterized protein LOC132198053 [Neocloeon triangulifer]